MVGTAGGGEGREAVTTETHLPTILLFICKSQAARLFFTCIFCTLCVFHNKTFLK